MVFGDTGENETFRKYEKGGIAASKLKVVPDKTAWTCAVTDDTNQTTFNKFFTGMKNWERVLGANLRRIGTADEVVILGDEVYPESKFLGTTTDDEGGVQWSEPSIIKDQDKRAKYWEDRRNCGWAAFLRSFDVTGSDLKLDNGIMHAKLVAMPGNHLYDVSPAQEIKFMDTVFPSAHSATTVWYNGSTKHTNTAGISWHNSVRMDTKTIAGGRTFTTVIFIDFNSSLLELSGSCHGKRTEVCVAQIQTTLNSRSTFWMAKAQVKAQDVYNHNEGLFYALAAASGVANAYIVLRAHHPPFNLEGDFLSFVNYRCASTELTGWTGLTTLQAFEKAKVALYLASHHHSAQILAFPYSKISDLKDKPKRVKNGDTTWLKCLAEGQACGDTPPTYSYNVNWADPKYLFIALVGNSGRYFDPIETDRGTYATLIWGRAGSTDDIPTGKEKDVKKEWKKAANSPNYYYGGAKVNFSDAGIKVRFHEVKPSATTTDQTAGLLLNTHATSDSIDYVDKNVAAKLKKRLNKMRRNH